MEVAAFIGGSITLAILGVKGYLDLNKRVTRIEIMQRLLLRKNGYHDDEELDSIIENELNNHQNRRGK